MGGVGGASSSRALFLLDLVLPRTDPALASERRHDTRVPEPRWSLPGAVVRSETRPVQTSGPLLVYASEELKLSKPTLLIFEMQM